MSKRKSVNGRPSGTDGSDFSYRMIVDSRYKRVAEGKSRLCSLIFAQGLIQFLAAGVIYLSTTEEGSLDKLSVTATVVFFVSLLIGELGRKRSRVYLLKLYLFGSSVAALLSVCCLFTDKSIELLKDSRWETSKCEFFKIVAIVLGLLVQIIAADVTSSLIHNMAPPKTAFG